MGITTDVTIKIGVTRKILLSLSLAASLVISVAAQPVFPPSGVTCSGTNCSIPAGSNLTVGTTLPGGAPANSIALAGNIYAGGSSIALNSATGIVGLFSGTCNASAVLAGDGSCKTVSSAFSAVASGTNTTAAMLVGTGASLAATGTGTITATGLGNASTIGPVAFTCQNGTVCTFDATASTGNTNAWFGADGSGTYSGSHVTAGSTRVRIIGGASQGSTFFNLLEVLNSAGNTMYAIGYDGSFGTFSSGIRKLAFSTTFLVASSDSTIQWYSGTNPVITSPDLGLSRLAAGKLGIGNGNNGDATGVLQAGGTIFTQTSAPTLANGQCSWSFTNNTTVTITCRGSDGTLRTGTVTIS